MFENFLATVLSEYGIFVTFELLTIAVLLVAIRILWKTNLDLTSKLVSLAENNTKVITQLVERLKEHDDDK